MIAGWYHRRREEEVAVRGALALQAAGVCSPVLLEGPPGCGKTALAQAVAEAQGASLIYSLLHSWTSDEELFCGVDVASAVAGDAASVRQDGVLARVARSSQTGFVVLCLDEIDKAPERVEGLLLDWLQTGRVPWRPGEHLQTRLDHVLVFCTSNGQRDLGDAFRRRCRSVLMSHLPEDVTVQVIAREARIGSGAAKLVWRALVETRGKDAPGCSLQEGLRCALEARLAAQSFQDMIEVLVGWGDRDGGGRKRARESKFAAPAWAEIQKDRRAK